MRLSWASILRTTLTAAVLLITLFVVGRNLVHIVQIQRQINTLEREAENYRSRIQQDSTLIEQLRYDDYLEAYARETFRMQRPNERVFLIE